MQRTHPPHNNTHSTQRKLARGAVLRCEPTRAMLGHAFTLCSSAICRQSPACSCTADLHLCRRDEVVVARQLKHAAYRTARVEQQHRWFLSHTQAPPVALEQTEAARGIAVARTIRCLGAVGGGSGVPSARGGIFRTCTSRAMPPVDSSSLRAALSTQPALEHRRDWKRGWQP